eukprot:3718183-Prymnesium_polylepis.1
MPPVAVRPPAAPPRPRRESRDRAPPPASARPDWHPFRLNGTDRPHPIPTPLDPNPSVVSSSFADVLYSDLRHEVCHGARGVV